MGFVERLYYMLCEEYKIVIFFFIIFFYVSEGYIGPSMY